MPDTLILCYHTVSSDWNDSVAVSGERFSAQMEVLARLGYRGVTFTEAVSESGGHGRRVAITFDDAFHSVLDRAFPVLAEHGWPATVFVVTDYGDGTRLIDWPRLDTWLSTPHERELRVLDWGELAQLQAAGWEVGSHTCSHPHLAQLSPEDLRRELNESREICAARMGRCDSLAYPYGEVNRKVVAAARDAGYLAAAALPERMHPVRPLEWPRVGVYNGDQLGRFMAKTAPASRWLRSTRHHVPNENGSLPRARVLVTDGQERSTLAAIRCLGDAGHRVTVTAPSADAPGFWSRRCTNRRIVPDPRPDLAGFLDFMEQLVTDVQHDLLLPGSDASLYAISLHRQRFERRLRLALPEHDVVVSCLSKSRLGEAAREAGLDTPDTVACGGLQDGIAAARAFGFPVVVKPCDVVVSQGRGLQRLSSTVVRDERELARAMAPHDAWLVQRYVPGSLISFAGVAVEEGLLAAVTTRYRRLWPPAAGDGSFMETFPVPPDLRAAVQGMIGSLGWLGVFQLEMLEAAGRFAVLDLNPGPFSSMGVARAAGVPLSALWCSRALGYHPTADEATAGTQYRWEDADARYAALALRHSGLASASAALRPHRSVAHAFFRADDPLPLLARGLQARIRLTPRGSERDGSARLGPGPPARPDR